MASQTDTLLICVSLEPCVRTYVFFCPAYTEMYKLRAHIDTISPDKLIQFIDNLSEKCQKLIVYRHPKEEAEREHIHALMVGCSITEKTIRERINKELQLAKSNKNYSVGSTYGNNVKITELTYPTYISYMSKGLYSPEYNKGFETDYVENLKQSYKPFTKEEPVKYQIEKITPVKKKTQFEISYESEIRYLQQYQNEDINWYDMYYIVKEVCKENKTRSDDNTIAYIIQDIQSRLAPEKQWNRIRNRVG